MFFKSQIIFIFSARIQYFRIDLKTFIKIYGPPLLKTIKKLEKIAPDMPEVCIMNMPLWMTQQMSSGQTTDSGKGGRARARSYFSSFRASSTDASS